jgi:hypothetical protein
MELEESDPTPSSGAGPGSHWEKCAAIVLYLPFAHSTFRRLVGNEYMSPVASPAMIVSKMTLSLFEGIWSVFVPLTVLTCP